MKVKNLSFSYHQNPFIENLNIEFKENQITTIIGSNGSGKSTLLMLLSRIYKPQTGFIEINQQNIQNYKIKEFAQKVAVVHQKNQINGDQDVKTIVGYGRLPYLHYSQKLSQEDYEIIDWALEVTNLKEYKNRTLKSLSGGQQQRVWIAMALAQKTPYLLLDEPTTYLDIRYQLELLRLLKEINQKYKITIIMVLHDINQAIQYSDNIIAIKKGRIIVEGKSNEVITSEVISGVLINEGFIILPELKSELSNETLIVNYGESGRRNRGLGYTIEVTIQFISAKTKQMICSCTAEGQGETEADDIRQAIRRALDGLFPKNNQ